VSGLTVMTHEASGQWVLGRKDAAGVARQLTYPQLEVLVLQHERLEAFAAKAGADINTVEEINRLRALLGEVDTALLVGGWKEDSLIRRVKAAASGGKGGVS
jgi:hypothetical protein